MKKITLITAILMCFSYTFSQVQKGSKLVGVSFGGFSYTSSDSKTTYSNTPTEYKSEGSSLSLGVYPNVAWFVKERLAVGGGISLSIYNSKSTSSNSASIATTESKYNQPSFYLSPYARYYFDSNSKGMPFFQLNYQYGLYFGNSNSTSSSGSSSETKYIPKGDWNAGLTFGYEHFVSEYVGIYCSVGFNYGKSKTKYDYKPSTGDGYSYTSYYSRFYVPLSLGLQIHLPAKSQ